MSIKVKFSIEANQKAIPNIELEVIEEIQKIPGENSEQLNIKNIVPISNTNTIYRYNHRNTDNTPIKKIYNIEQLEIQSTESGQLKILGEKLFKIITENPENKHIKESLFKQYIYEYNNFVDYYNYYINK